MDVALLAVVIWVTIGAVVVWSDRSVRRSGWMHPDDAETYNKLRGM